MGSSYRQGGFLDLYDVAKFEGGKKVKEIESVLLKERECQRDHRVGRRTDDDELERVSVRDQTRQNIFQLPPYETAGIPAWLAC